MARIRRTPRKITPTSPGEPIIIDGVEVATIWSAGPKTGTVWGLLPDGSTRVYKTPTSKDPRFIDMGPGPIWDEIKRVAVSVAIAGRRLVVRYESPDWRIRNDHELHVSGCPLIDQSTRSHGYSLSGTTLLDWALRELRWGTLEGRPSKATLCECLDEFRNGATGAPRYQEVA